MKDSGWYRGTKPQPLFWWSSFAGTLALRVREAEHGFYYRVLFHLWPIWCVICGRFTFGCREHWFCQTCEPCKVDCERDKEAMDSAAQSPAAGEAQVSGSVSTVSDAQILINQPTGRA